MTGEFSFPKNWHPKQQIYWDRNVLDLSITLEAVAGPAHPKGAWV